MTPRQVEAQNKLDKAGLADDSRDEAEVLVLVPFRDKWFLTESCLRYLSAQILPASMRLNVVLIDNRSREDASRVGPIWAQKTHPDLNIKIFKADYDFNFSRMNNEAFQLHRTDDTKAVLFLNNDVEMRDPRIVQKMVHYLLVIREAGAIGCTLLYPDRRIQHAFAAPGVKIIAAHPLKRRVFNAADQWFSVPARPVPAVTGAALMVRPEDFARVGMFDENLPILGQDIDLCLRLQTQLGLFCVSVASGETFHLEGPTKENVFPRAEILKFYEKWPDCAVFEQYYSSTFSRWSEQPLVRFCAEPRFPASVFGESS